MPTVPATDDSPVVLAAFPFTSPMARAMLDNGYSFDSVTEWLAGRPALNAVRTEAWWLGQE